MLFMLYDSVILNVKMTPYATKIRNNRRGSPEKIRVFSRDEFTRVGVGHKSQLGRPECDLAVL